MSEEKQYLDQCTQTSPGIAEDADAGRNTEPAEAAVDAVADAQDTSQTSILSASSLIIHTRPPTPTTSEFGDGSVDGGSPPATIHTAVRALKHPQVTYLRPAAPGAQTLKSPSARIVSLPETVSKFSARQETSRRVVSMPERGQHAVLLSPGGSSYTDDFLPEIESPGRVRVHSVATDMPHTPSPPSSPDSVVFIANKSPLADGFLRQKSGLCRSHTPESKEKTGELVLVSSRVCNSILGRMGHLGQVTAAPDTCPPWAVFTALRSVSLVGFLGIVISRLLTCFVSGAEGTIIEEQDNLPRMIWGLEGEDTASQRHQQEPPTHKTVPAPARKQPSRPTQPVPPRFNNQKNRTKQEIERQTQITYNQLLTPEPEPPVAHSQHFVNSMSHDSKYTLPSHGPIDLSDFLRPRVPGTTPDVYLQESDFSRSAHYGPLGDSWHTFDSTGDLDMNWQSLSMAQDRLRQFVSDSTRPYPGNNRDDFGKNSGLPSSLSLPSLVSSRSPIILDPPSQLGRTLLSQHSPMSSQHSQSTLNTPMTSHSGPQRLSALEIAQKYRQQQMLQNKQPQSMLPTPPSSSSPIWSSRFSPYQESVWSPDFLSAARLPNISVKDADPQHLSLLRQAEVLQQLRSAEHARLGISGRDARAQHSLLAPAAQVQDYLIDGFDISLPGSSLNGPSFGGLPMHVQQGRPPVSLGSSTLSQPHRAPGHARPAANTPMGSFNIRRHGQQQQEPSAPIYMAAPLSPTSPKPRPRNISQQNPRSIPLARLVQRLSSVPEEESTGGTPRKERAAHRDTGGLAAPPMQAGPGAPTGARPQPFNSDGPKSKRKPVPSVGQPARQPGVQAKNKGEHARTGPAEAPPLSQQPPTSTSIPKGPGNAQRDESPERVKRPPPRGRGKGWRARRGHAVNGPERGDGGLTVRS